MQKVSKRRKIVIVNQAVNYLSVDLCNAFVKEFQYVELITGSIHIQGEKLDEGVKVYFINKWNERPVSKKIISYLCGSIRIYFLLLTRFRKYEVFFISVPPFGYLLKLLLPNRCSVLIWDVYPDLLKITGIDEIHFVYRLWVFLNRKVFKRFYRIFTIGDRMADLIAQYVPKEKILITPIWSIFQENGKVNSPLNPFIIKHHLEGKFIVQYSGNIGKSHNVEKMVELAALMKDETDILFQIIGRGPRVPELQRMVVENKLPNCNFLPFQTDEMFPYSLSAASIGVVILDEKASTGSVPSKCYNLMSFGIPSLYFASSDSQLNEYCETYHHAECFDEIDLQGAKKYILNLKNNKEIYEKYSLNALLAAKNLKRDNASQIVELYRE